MQRDTAPALQAQRLVTAVVHNNNRHISRRVLDPMRQRVEENISAVVGGDRYPETTPGHR
ncbi:Uncharacterised protein [Mycobacteroides abscessus subsp. massiliense]|nr:Uncharacterised protein [Mycobacteroides abscessus subsp. massiliense]